MVIVISTDTGVYIMQTIGRWGIECPEFRTFAGVIDSAGLRMAGQGILSALSSTTLVVVRNPLLSTTLVVHCAARRMQSLCHASWHALCFEHSSMTIHDVAWIVLRARALILLLSPAAHK